MCDVIVIWCRLLVVVFWVWVVICSSLECVESVFWRVSVFF